MKTRGALGYTDCAILHSANRRTFTVTQEPFLFCQKSLSQGSCCFFVQKERKVHRFFLILHTSFFLVTMTKASTFFDKVIAATAPSKPSIDLNEDTNTTPESNGYPPWANKIGHFIYMLWDKCLWSPFSRTWAFLNRWTNLTFWIFASIPIGVLVGYYQPEFATEIKPLGTAFIRMIKICVVPLIFSTLVVGIAGMFVPSIV